MTIDDFDVNEISDKLAIREESNNPSALQAAQPPHDDGHNDATNYGYHYDTSNPPAHDDDRGGYVHDDVHYDIQHDDACWGVFYCP